MSLDIASLRLYNQQLTTHQFKNPVEIVSWFGAMQSQDFAAAKWALALRMNNHTDTEIEQTFNNGDILRTHIMRPTWHFVAPIDIRWMLELTSPRVKRFNGHYYRKSGLDKSIFQKSNEVIRKALVKDNQLTRDEIHVKLEEAHIPTKDLGLTYSMMQAELDGIICSGPRRGKQFTYMLLDERTSKDKEKTLDEALAELTRRYFKSHGPAQAKDFSWWSGLTLTDARRGIELIKTKLVNEEKNGKIYWFFPPEQEIKLRPDEAFLIPGFDEYFIAYADRSDILDPNYAKELNQGGGMINGAIVIEGKMVGGWKRKFTKKSVILTIRLFEKISPRQHESIEKQIERYGNFHTLPVEIREV